MYKRRTICDGYGSQAGAAINYLVITGWDSNLGGLDFKPQVVQIALCMYTLCIYLNFLVMTKSIRP